MSLFGNLDLDEFRTIYRVAVASYGKSEPPNGSEALAMADLGLTGHGDGTIFTSSNGRGKAIVARFEDQLVIGFRGTDKWNDLKDYNNISLSKNYFKEFQPLINAVAEYNESLDLDVTFTGISLGGAVTNIIADRATNGRWGGAFEDAQFVGIAAPYLSSNRKSDVFNFGLQNDPVYHIVPGSWTGHAKEMATRHVFIYQHHKYFRDDNIDDRLGNHDPSNIADFMDALEGLTVGSGELLADVLTPKSYVILDDAKGSVNAGRLQHGGDTVLTVIGQNHADKLYGATDNHSGSHREWMFGRGGADQIFTRGGRDELYGGDGNDVLNGGSKADLMFGGSGDDLIFLQDHRDRAEGGAGNDKFNVAEILPMNGRGLPRPDGNEPAQVFIDQFASGEDRISLSRIDGHLGRKGHQDLQFAGFERYDETDGLSELELGGVNDLTPGSVTIFEDGKGKTLVILNLDGDRHRELEIVIEGTWGDISGDLIL